MNHLKKVWPESGVAADCVVASVSLVGGLSASPRLSKVIYESGVIDIPGSHQDELAGVVPEPTHAQGAALTLVEDRERLDVLKERVKAREEYLVASMHQDQVSVVKVRDGLGQLHLFELEKLEKIRHREV